MQQTSSRLPGDAIALDPFARARMELEARLRQQYDEPPLPHLDELIAEIGELHPLPAVASRVLPISEEDHFSAHELATIVSSDQALTMTLLRLANSAYYGYARRITTVRDAVVLLGFRSVRAAVLASCVVKRRAHATSLDHVAFWQHSIATGLLAEILARTEGAYQDHAFTAGVLHNVGVLALEQRRPDMLARVIEHAQQEAVTVADAIETTLGFSGEDLGCALAEHWNFPVELVEAVRDHRRAALNGMDQTLTGYVARARVLLRASGINDGVEAPPAPSRIPGEWASGPVSIALQQSGGMGEVMERVDAFLDAALA